MSRSSTLDVSVYYHNDEDDPSHDQDHQDDNHYIFASDEIEEGIITTTEVEPVHCGAGDTRTTTTREIEAVRFEVRENRSEDYLRCAARRGKMIPDMYGGLFIVIQWTWLVFFHPADPRGIT